MIKVIITDDHQIFIDGLRNCLEPAKDITILAEALSGRQLLEFLKTQTADVVLLDISMPKPDGIETLKIIKQNYPTVNVIMLTQFGETRLVMHCMKHGAKGYVLKTCAKEELLEAIRTVYDGGVAFCVNGGVNGKNMATESEAHLSPHEKAVLQLILQELDNKQIAHEMNIEENTVKTYKERLKVKAGVTTMVGLIKWAIENNMY